MMKEVKKRKVEGYVCGGEKTKGKKNEKRNAVRVCRIKKKGKNKRNGITIFS